MPENDLKKEPARPSPAKALYDFLSSVPLAITLLIALAATSMAGTVILQQGDPTQYAREYGEGVTGLIRLLALDDMYHSWWFLMLLALLLINITLCSAKRFPRAWRLMTGPAEPLDDELFRRLKYRSSLRHTGDPGAVLTAASLLLGNRVSRPRRLEGPGHVTLAADRGWYGRLGVFITHFSILILAMGVLVGGLSGFRGDVNVLEGQTIDRVVLRRKQAYVPLGFTVRCDKFTVEYYPNGQPKEYASDLVVIEEGKEVARKHIEVNHPLTWRGISFFQSSYGMDPGSTVTLEVLDPSGRMVAPDLTVRAEQAFTVPNDSANYVIEKIEPFVPGAGAVVEMGRVSPEGHSDFALLQANPQYDAARRGAVHFRIKSLNLRQYTGLQVAYDPGVPVIWLACSIMIVGLYITFFAAHRKVWVRVESDPANPTVLVAGTTSRNPLAFEKDFQNLVTELKQSFKGR